MTKEEFNAISWNSMSVVSDDYGHTGHVLSVNFEYGIIHYDDDAKCCSFGRHYKELRYIGGKDKAKVLSTQKT